MDSHRTTGCLGLCQHGKKKEEEGELWAKGQEQTQLRQTAI